MLEVSDPIQIASALDEIDTQIQIVQTQLDESISKMRAESSPSSTSYESYLADKIAELHDYIANRDGYVPPDEYEEPFSHLFRKQRKDILSQLAKLKTKKERIANTRLENIKGDPKLIKKIDQLCKMKEQYNDLANAIRMRMTYFNNLGMIMQKIDDHISQMQIFYEAHCSLCSLYNDHSGDTFEKRRKHLVDSVQKAYDALQTVLKTRSYIGHALRIQAKCSRLEDFLRSMR